MNNPFEPIMSHLEAVNHQLAEIRARLDAVQMQPAREWYTVKEAAERYEVTTRTVRNWIDAGTVEAKGSGKATMVRISPDASPAPRRSRGST